MTGRLLVRVAATAVTAVLVLAVLVGAGLTGAGGAGAPGCGLQANLTSTTLPPGAPAPDRAARAQWTDEQVGNAATIVAVGAAMRVPPRGWVVAVGTAIQESRLYNLRFGDRDSVGLFQQRPSQGWGSPDQILHPAYAAHRFYTALLAVPGWQAMPLTEAAQAVQHSAYPAAYARWETDARTLVQALTGRADLAARRPGCPVPAAPQGRTQPAPGPVTSAFHAPTGPDTTASTWPRRTEPRSGRGL